jgi:hypothetical protein
MKKTLSLILALVMLIGVTSAFAEGKEIDGVSDRGITIHPAGLNEVDDLVSPTTGRNLMEIEVPNGYLGMAVTGEYQPILVQISNADNGLGSSSSIKNYRNAPVNGIYADVVYEALQKKGGGESRMTYVYSDVVPDFAGFVRSTRIQHARLRAEWDSAFVTSGWNYAVTDVPDVWTENGLPNPTGKRTIEDPGLVYVGDLSSKPWGPYVYRICDKTGKKYSGANTELFNLTGLLTDIIPKDHVAANHTFKFTDDIPAGGDDASFVYIKFGNEYYTNSRLEYDESTNSYIRYVKREKGEDMPYRTNILVEPEVKKIQGDGKNVNGLGVVIQGLEAGDPITFNNVIVQQVDYNWISFTRPSPVLYDVDPEKGLVGKGNADYFMGGKHLSGVWERKGLTDRTVFYGPDGNEIELQRGRTLIILMPYGENGAGVSYE